MSHPPNQYPPPPPGQALLYAQPAAVYHVPPPQKQGISAGKVVLIVMGTVGFLMFGSCAVCSLAVGAGANAAAEREKEEQAEAEKTLEECKTTEAVEWASVAAALKDNEARVASAWKGSCAKITGVVDRIDSDFRDKPFVVIGTGERFSLNGLHCKPADEAKALELSKGQTITVWGVGGSEIIGSLVLEHCDW